MRIPYNATSLRDILLLFFLHANQSLVSCDRPMENRYQVRKLFHSSIHFINWRLLSMSATYTVKDGHFHTVDKIDVFPRHKWLMCCTIQALRIALHSTNRLPSAVLCHPVDNNTVTIQSKSIRQAEMKSNYIVCVYCVHSNYISKTIVRWEYNS